MSKIWVTNGIEIHRIDEHDLLYYINKGYKRGKKRDNDVIIPWNKGLTAEDPRVASYVTNKPKNYKKHNTAEKKNNRCTSCQMLIKADHKFCPYCGKKFS